MAGEILLDLLRANLAAAAAILVVLLLRRPVAHRFGAGAAYALWAVAPLAALASLMPARRVLVVEPAAAPASVSAVEPLAAAPAPTVATLPIASLDVTPVLLALWLAGAFACLAVLFWRQRNFSRALGPLTSEAGLYRSRAAGVGPALIGSLRPRIVLPADFEARFSPEERAVVIAHERTHLRRGDHLVNGFVAVLQCVCWFNPLVHLAAPRLRVDQELACDALVVARHPRARRSYAEAMLKTQLAPVAPPLGCHWPASAEHPLKQRISMLAADLPSTQRRAAGLVLALGLSLGAGVAAWAAQPPRIEAAPPAAEPRTFVGPEAAADVRAPAAFAMADADAESVATIARVRAAPAARPAPDAELQAGLRRAARTDDVALARRMIAAGADVNHHIPGDPTPLAEAAGRGQTAMVRFLLDQGADANGPAPGDGNPLIRAAGRGQRGAAELLVARGADVNAFVLGDETPLINAARADDLWMVRFLVERGADVNLTVPAHPWGTVMRSPMSVTSDPRIKAYLKSRGARG